MSGEKKYINISILCGCTLEPSFTIKVGIPSVCIEICEPNPINSERLFSVVQSITVALSSWGITDADPNISIAGPHMPPKPERLSLVLSQAWKTCSSTPITSSLATTLTVAINAAVATLAPAPAVALTTASAALTAAPAVAPVAPAAPAVALAAAPAVALATAPAVAQATQATPQRVEALEQQARTFEEQVLRDMVGIVERHMSVHGNYPDFASSKNQDKVYKYIRSVTAKPNAEPKILEQVRQRILNYSKK